MRPLERLRRDQDDARFFTVRERLLAAASMVPFFACAPVLSLLRPVFADVSLWWVLLAVAGWVMLAAWPIAVVNVRLRERVRRRRRAQDRARAQHGRHRDA